MNINKLRIIVLRHLAHGPHTGYQLVKEIRLETGWKPSFGSMYPLLNQLHEEELVTIEEVGKQKRYHLTEKGRQNVKEFDQQHDLLVQHMEETQQVLMRLCNVEKDPFFERVVTSLRSGKVPFREVIKSGYNLRKELARLEQQGLMTKHKEEITGIMDEATKKLHRIQRTKKEKAAP